MDESSKILYVGLDVHKDSIASPTPRTIAAPRWCRWERSGPGRATSTN